MKLIHLADLHLGKRVCGYSMLEDQKYILAEICELIDTEQPQAVLIAGDVYDRSIPSEEAVCLFDDFLTRLVQRHVEVFLISGNHDSAERVAFGCRLMEKSGVHVSPVYDGSIQPLTMEDADGPVHFWLIPFLKPAHVRAALPEYQVEGYTEAMETVVKTLPLDPGARNIALVHQFITGGSVCDSEEHSVGGLDDISASVFDCFDYVALGHLHGPQYVGRPEVRYAGSPLKYSFSEADQKKSVTVVELHEKGRLTIREIPLRPQRNMIRLRGSFSELASDGCSTDDYCEITLTDEVDVPNALARLQHYFPFLMTLRYDNTRTRRESHITGAVDVEEKTPLELFAAFYEEQNGQTLSEEQCSYLDSLIAEIWEGEA